MVRIDIVYCVCCLSVVYENGFLLRSAEPRRKEKKDLNQTKILNLQILMVVLAFDVSALGNKQIIPESGKYSAIGSSLGLPL